MYTFLTLVLAVLPFLVAATPFEERSKMQCGFEAFERNTGAAHPSTSQLKFSTKRDNGDQLTGYYNKNWCGSITVGTLETYVVQSQVELRVKECREEFKLKYLDNSTVSATQQRLGAATTYSLEFRSDTFPEDGHLGLAYESLSNYGASTVFQSLVSQGQVHTPAFSFYLTESGSELYIGGTNKDHYKGSFTYMPVATQVRIYTVIAFDRFSVDNNIAGLLASSDTPVSITFSSKKFQISALNFKDGQLIFGGSCIGSFAGIDSLGFWIVGDVFLKNVYTTSSTTFDLGNNRVGLASLV
ncbi:acid protease [Lactarius indigo]|nr:acid protease [Lactarius indigo]